MNIEDLIFEPFEIRCPRCGRTIVVAFEVLRLNQEITCARCGNQFFADKNIDALLKLIEIVESPDVQIIPIEDE